jgi:hypothetical protein
MLDLTSFRHGQIKSKLWLCDVLGPFLPDDSEIYILGSWHNVLGNMLFTKFPEKIHSLVGIDSDPEAISVAEKITNYWYIEGKLNNVCANANTYKLDITEKTVVINCSPEHFESNEWLSNIEHSPLVCIQSSNITDPGHPWYIKQPSETFDKFLNNYPLRDIKFSGIQEIAYSHFSYERYMVIGNK